MLRLIVNVDDFGLSAGVNEAVFELAELGAVTSTTVMVNMPHAARVTDLAQTFPQLGIGLHVNLTEGRPVSDPATVPSLVRGDGLFWDYPAFRKRMAMARIRKREIAVEYEAQWRTLYNAIGDRVDHVDSHQNIHKLWPVAHALSRVSREMGPDAMRSSRRLIVQADQTKLAVRSSLAVCIRRGMWRRAFSDLYLQLPAAQLRKRFRMPAGELKAASMRKQDMLSLLTTRRHHGVAYPGVLELVCHPATRCDDLEHSRLARQRVTEYDALRGNAFCRFMDTTVRCTFEDC